MSDKRKHWFRRVRDILEFAETIDSLLKNVSEDEFAQDTALYLATERLLQNIGEASIHLPDEIKARAPEIEWPEMAAMRHILVHGYDIVDENIVWYSATVSIHPLRDFLQTLKGDELK